MDMNLKRGLGFWILIIIAIFLNIMFLLGQTWSLFDYEFTVSIGLQESLAEVKEIGVAWAKGFAFGDTIFYMPLFIIGIVGLFKRRFWGILSMFGALAITAYWPLVHLYTMYIGKNAFELSPEKYVYYPIFFLLLVIYSLWSMWFLYKKRDGLVG